MQSISQAFFRCRNFDIGTQQTQSGREIWLKTDAVVRENIVSFVAVNHLIEDRFHPPHTVRGGTYLTLRDGNAEGSQ